MVEVRLADPYDNKVPRRTVGEVQMRGPNIMLGYWKKPELTAEALRGGWYHSGDGGYMDEEGFVYIVDRLKDMSITGGENVYCAEVESAISTLVSISEVAVIGIADEKKGAQTARLLREAAEGPFRGNRGQPLATYDVTGGRSCESMREPMFASPCRPRFPSLSPPPSGNSACPDGVCEHVIVIGSRLTSKTPGCQTTGGYHEPRQ
jgi:hypothetical protein